MFVSRCPHTNKNYPDQAYVGLISPKQAIKLIHDLTSVSMLKLRSNFELPVSRIFTISISLQSSDMFGPGALLKEKK
jgi:hypothetical protein